MNFKKAFVIQDTWILSVAQNIYFTLYHNSNRTKATDAFTLISKRTEHTKMDITETQITSEVNSINEIRKLRIFGNMHCHNNKT